MAYFATGAKATGPARQIPAFRRILPAGPWMVTEADHPDHGRGALAWPKDTPQPAMGSLAWRKCPDGLWYGADGDLPTQEALAREGCPPGITLDLSTGVSLTIPLAAAAPRAIAFDAGGLGEPSTDYGREAWALYDRLAESDGQGLDLADPGLIRVILLAIQTAYRVTEEILTDLGWVASPDLDPITMAIFGLHPKASGGDGGGSPSPPEAC